MLHAFSDAQAQPPLSIGAALEPALKPVRIITVGSPYGDDAVAWAAAAALRQMPRFQDHLAACVSLLERDRPGLGLVELLRGAALNLIVDAVVDGGPAGRLLRIDAFSQLQLLRQPSTHGFGLAESLAMARALGALNGAWIILGVSIKPPAATDLMDQLSPAVAAVVGPLTRALLVEARQALPLGI